MRILFLILVLANIAFAAWQYYTHDNEVNIRYERHVDKGNLVLVSEQEEKEGKSGSEN